MSKLWLARNCGGVVSWTTTQYKTKSKADQTAKNG